MARRWTWCSSDSDGRDLDILERTDVSATLIMLKKEGLIRSIGFSGKTAQGTAAALAWADVIMVEYHLQDRLQESVIAQAAASDVGVVVKKGLASGRLNAGEAIQFVLRHPAVVSLVVGGLNLDHIRQNVYWASRWVPPSLSDGRPTP